MHHLREATLRALSAGAPISRPTLEDLRRTVEGLERSMADFLAELEVDLAETLEAHPSMRRYIENARDDFERAFMQLERACADRRGTLGSRVRR